MENSQSRNNRRLDGGKEKISVLGKKWRSFNLKRQ